jgi:drug/metabolite transporter (DMT)-like permease
MSRTASLAATGRRPIDLLPGIMSAVSFSAADILGKIVFNDGMDVLSFVTTRGVLTALFFWLWLRGAPPPRRHTRRERIVSLAVGVMFAGNVFGLLLAIQLLPLSIAILTYFIYPLLTGIAGAATGIDRLGWRGFIAAVVAFVGLAMMLGARLGDVELLGVASALAAAVLRVVSLLITRASLRESDSRLNTWYSLAPSAVIFVLFSLLTQTWNPPQSSLGWVAFVGMSVTSTVSVLTIFVSIARIGPFRTALIMNLEPLLSTLGSVALLGEALSPIQATGGALMLAALCAFQLRR